MAQVGVEVGNRTPARTPACLSVASLPCPTLPYPVLVIDSYIYLGCMFVSGALAYLETCVMVERVGWSCGVEGIYHFPSYLRTYRGLG